MWQCSPINMDQEELTNRINELADYARQQPAAYRMRVALLAGVGYAYLLAVVFLLLLVVYLTLSYVAFNFVTIKLAWIPLVLVWLVLRSLWITIPVPSGIELRTQDAPKLFAVVQDVQRTLNGPRAHHLLLSDEFNAGIVQRPRFGMFGGSVNYLVVGLPLLKALGPEEFRSVLAHEFGHLSGKHGRFSGWIYRLRQSWTEILTRVHQERQYARFIFEPFLKWYTPFFNTYSFVLARSQEYEADTYSAEIAGKEITARTLVKLATRDRALSDEFWPTFFKQANNGELPPSDPFDQMLSALESPTEHSKRSRWVLEALKVKTGYEDTHPALADRLAGLGYTKEELSTVALRADPSVGEKESAANFYLDQWPEDFVVGANRLWREQITTAWREQYSRQQAALTRLKELELANRARALSIDEEWERARLTISTEDLATALPLIRTILETDPEHGEANLALGAALLEQKDDTGIALLEKAMSVNEMTTGEACSLLYSLHLERGETKEADEYYGRAARFYEKMERVSTQAWNFSANDRFEPHGLSEPAIETLRTELSGVRGLGRTYLVRKILDETTEPMYVIGAFAAFTWRNGENGKHWAPLIEELAATVKSIPNSIILAMDQHAYLVRKFEDVPGSVILIGGDENVEYRQ